MIVREVLIERLKVRDKVWRLVKVHRDLMKITPNHGVLDGDTDAPEVEDKEIRINEALKGRDELETYLHEILHAACWDLTEDAVEETTHAMAVALWRLGYRKAK